MEQVAAQIKQTSEESALLEGFRHFPANLPAAEQQRLRAQATSAYQSNFLPAWKKLYAYLGSTYLPKARPNIAMTSLPEGPDMYQALIRSSTTTQMTPEEIHNLGLAEVKRIESEMQALLKEAGFSGTVAEYERGNWEADPAQHFGSKDEMLAYCRNIAKIIEPELPNQFGQNSGVAIWGAGDFARSLDRVDNSCTKAPASEYFRDPGGSI